jgi:predicted HTH transcriptional regulator
MLPINIDEITSDHIASLVNEKVTERKTLEYKERLPEGSDGAKKEFLADVCSFANASGGDIVYGIRDERDADGKPTGIPESITGVLDANMSAVCIRLEAMVRGGISPRVPSVQTKAVEIPEQGSVVLLRTGRSWIRPHMVTYGGTSRFYSRHSTGKYQLDVQEIGQAFAEQKSLGEELSKWRADRVARLLSDEGPVRLDGQANSFFTSFRPLHWLGNR